jgi:hypothetical protein
MNQDDALSGAVLVGGSLAFAALEGAAFFAVGAVGLGLLSYKAFADVANRPVDGVFTRREQQLERHIDLLRASDLDEQTKRALTKPLKDAIVELQKRRRHHAAGWKAVGQWVGLGVFAFPLLAPVYLGGWACENLLSAKQKQKVRKALKPKKTVDEHLGEMEERLKKAFLST